MVSADYTPLMDAEYGQTEVVFNGESSKRLSLFPRGHGLVALGFLFPALAGFNFGFNIGGIGGAGYLLKQQFPLLGENAFLEGAITSAALFGAAVSCVIAMFVGDYLGRRRTIAVAGVFYTVGAALMSFTPNAVFYYVFILGQVLYGFGIGFAMHSAPLYIAECVPSHLRGILVSLKEGFIVLGIFAGNGLTYLFRDATEGWRYVLGFALIPAVILTIGMLMLPPTPRWLVLRSLKVEHEERSRLVTQARDVYAQYNGCSQSQAELAVKEMFTTIAGQSTNTGSWSELLVAKKQLVVGIGLVIFQQITGQPTVLYYLPSIVSGSAKDLTSSQNILIGVLVSFVKMLVTLVTVFTVEKGGRRPLLLTGIFFMAVALVGMGLNQSLSSLLSDTFSRGLVIASLGIYVSAYQIGFGPITWLLISEIFPLHVRSRAQGISTFSNFFFNLLVTFAFPSIDQLLVKIGVSSFWMYLVITVVSLFFVFFRVPETKGRTMEEIEITFDKW